MKRMTYFVMALALVLGLAQCKKEQTPTNNENEGVRITLTMDGGNSGSRVIVNPNAPEGYATVTFEAGDVIYVGNNGSYVGYLVYDGTTNKFSGSIDDSNLNEADYLHFYFMGNKGPADSKPTEAVSISDQTEKYPVISYAHSTQLYKSDVTAYSAKLQNYCAIVKFTTTNIDADITITGMNNTVSVNFGANNANGSVGIGNNPYSPGKTGDGEITLHRVSNTERWAILLEQDAVNGATVTADGYLNSTCDVPVIANNTYHSTGVSISMTPTPTETTITWNSSTISSINISGNGSNFTNGGITVTSNSSDAKWNNSGVISTITLKSINDKLTFSTANGTITKIIITLNPTSGSVEGTPSSGWDYDGLPNYTLTWTGSYSYVDLGCVSSKGFPGGGIGPGIETEKFKVAAITNVEFTVQQ